MKGYSLQLIRTLSTLCLLCNNNGLQELEWREQLLEKEVVAGMVGLK